jgi:hypothetical protein
LNEENRWLEAGVGVWRLGAGDQGSVDEQADASP